MLGSRRLPRILVDDQALRSPPVASIYKAQSSLDARSEYFLGPWYLAFANPYCSPARSIDPLARPHDRTRVSEGPTHEQSRPPTRRGSPVETAFSQATAVKDAGALPETNSDTEDIFNVTDQERTGSVVVSPSDPSDCVDQQDLDNIEETHAQSKTTRVDTANVLLQDTAMPDDSLDGNRTDPVLETKLIPDHSRQEHRVNQEEHLTEQTQQPSSCQRLEGEHDPTSRQHTVESQHSNNTEQSVQDSRPTENPQSSNALRTVAPVPRVNVTHKAPSSNENRNIQQPPTPADTVLPTLESAKQPLREVTNRSTSPRVTKNKRKSSRPGPVGRNPKSSSYTAAQLFQLAEYMEEQERLQDQQKWVKSLAATQEQLEKANQHKSKLQDECAQLKVSLEKYSRLTEHLKTIVKFENGLGKDIGNLQSSRDKTDGELKRVMSKVQAIHNSVTSSAEQGARMGARVIEMRATSLILLRDYQVSLTSLESQKSDLERRLQEAYDSLTKEKSSQAAFDARLKPFETLNETISKINDRLSEFKAYIERSNSSSEACRGLFELVKQESAVISDQLRSSGTNMETMKTSVEALASG
jgi:predicted  nucleic acid-binding Zn-ribbon protein